MLTEKEKIGEKMELSVGDYAVFKNEVYQANDITSKTVTLVSRKKETEKLGFTKYIFPKEFENRDILPDIYEKIVDKSELTELYRAEYYAIYKNQKFSVRSSLNKENVVLGSSDAQLVNELGFKRTDKYFYEKEVPKNEVIIEEVRTNIIK
ncbi:hypothetical protein [Enterococcus sp. LJL51]|uniref:hypothetical protein n=1 Tax=Enterococcus sp. LJL51 TaxID=3416656 RepID=UPI003CF36134